MTKKKTVYAKKSYENQLRELITLIQSCGSELISASLEPFDDDSRWASICFSNIEELQMFMDAVVGDFNPNPNSLYARITGQSNSEFDWEIISNVWNMNSDLDENNKEVAFGQPEFKVVFDLIIPRSDMPTLIKKMKVEAEEYQKLHEIMHEDEYVCEDCQKEATEKQFNLN